MARAWVIDTSSIICIQGFPKAVRPTIWAALARLAESDQLFFPAQVLEELERNEPDEALEWARRVARQAQPMLPPEDLLVLAKSVLARLPKLIDPLKLSSGRDEADPYVVATGLYRRQLGDDVTIVTDDYRPLPRKTSLSDAAGVFGLPSVTIGVFLSTEGIWDGVEGT